MLYNQDLFLLSCRSFSGTMSALTNGGKKWQTKLSSAGLVYLHFGHRVIAQLLGNSQSADENTVDVIYNKVMWFMSPLYLTVCVYGGEVRFIVILNSMHMLSWIRKKNI